MTIKKRLFVSNILMIVLPIVIAIITMLILGLILNGIFHGSLFETIRELEHEQEQRFTQSHATINAQLVFVAFLFFSAIITLVYFTNRLLIKYVFREIEQPLEVLSGGVHQIKNGNLNYRIVYDTENEFKPVCEDFNEMAARLEDMVNARQKDETSRRELIAGISHDLRTPLTSIKAYLEGIEKGVASTPEAQKSYLDIIKSETDDLEYIINQLFLFSKLDTGGFPFHLELINIGQELRQLIDSRQKEYDEKGLTISLLQNLGNMYAEIDAVQFRNVIFNIWENSVKYKNKDYAEMKITCGEKDANVIITLTDNGPGVPESILENLFDVFYRGDTSRSDPSNGSGLGLAISKKIIERLGGKIQAETASGGGLAIEITLPKHGRKAHEKNTDY